MSESQLDILITRVIDGRASTADWAALDAAGAADPSIWRELAMAQRQDAGLRDSVCAAVTVADGVELPSEQIEVSAMRAQAGLSRRLGRVAAWGGWAMAGALALAFVTHPAHLPDKSVQPASIVAPIESAADALSRYLEKGREEGGVIGEVPDRVVLNTSTGADGKTEVVFLRQIVEKVKIDDLYRYSSDEAGNPTPVKVHLVVVGHKPAM